jgi:hypothetical protein
MMQQPKSPAIPGDFDNAKSASAEMIKFFMQCAASDLLRFECRGCTADRLWGNQKGRTVQKIWHLSRATRRQRAALFRILRIE